ncbi:hypothetical protein TSUD_26290 [Trifolium subterraneum]|uniref:Uncharacterized protein n=1 Tax=Trifolium subterraneum TaxID=3900 RepID=A0A2Z6PJ88_TRISU|nr:hypothetical protein TSUD_26290 [Trifolium subterraneum]
MVMCFIDMNKELVRIKGKGGRTPLHLASEIGDVDILAELVLACPDSIEDVTVKGQTALHIAAENEKYEALHLLVYFLKKNTKRDASKLEYKILNLKDEDENTILHIVVENKEPEGRIDWLDQRVQVNQLAAQEN